MESASYYNFIQFEALANELCAKSWASIGRTKYAKLHMSSAYQLYRQWGAIVKCQHIRKNYSFLLDTRESDDSFVPDIDSSAFDVLSVLKASQTLSTEVSLELFLDNMMKIIIENAGAQRGVFMLEENMGNLLVVAEGGHDNMQVDTLRAVPLESYLLFYFWVTVTIKFSIT